MENIEVEMKYKITEEVYRRIVDFFLLQNQESRVEKQNDIYFSPIHFPFLGGEIDNECLRLRILEDKNVLSYKKFIVASNDKPAHCVEHELEINDIKMLKLILNDLRIQEEFTLKKERRYYIYKEKIEIALDYVECLGYFIELEIIDTSDIDGSIKEIKSFIEKFDITEDMRNYDGYSYLLFRQKEKNSTS